MVEPSGEEAEEQEKQKKENLFEPGRGKCNEIRKRLKEEKCWKNKEEDFEDVDHFCICTHYQD